jgi:hypothetical protein
MFAAVESKIDKSAKIIVACSAGGTMRPSQNLPEGQQSRYVNFSDSTVTILYFNFPCYEIYSFTCSLPQKDMKAYSCYFLQITDSSLPISPKWLHECLPLRRGPLQMVQRGFASRV